MEHFGNVAFNPIETRLFLFSRCVYVSNIMHGEWIFVKCSGYVGYHTRLFHAWLDYFTPFETGAAEVCTLIVLLVVHVFLMLALFLFSLFL